MSMNAAEILAILDHCCDEFVFPMLDNGHVYLAATRLSLYRSTADWAMVIEVFGFSPGEGFPSIGISTFGSRIHARRPHYKDPVMQARYVERNPRSESAYVYPVKEGAWRDEGCEFLVSTDVEDIVVRDTTVRLPEPSLFAEHDIALIESPRVLVFELCRYLAGVARDKVLATAQERRVNVPPELDQVLQLEEWHHPDVVDDSARPSWSETFQQLAKVLETGDVTLYRPTQVPNTHWRNWPRGGTL
ncbi:MAG: hypothetical protein AABZ53_00240 [Planctomycetota bacterium]